MLSSIIVDLRKHDHWQFFVQFFQAQQNELLLELQSGSVKDITRLEVINAQLETFERLKNLDAWADKSNHQSK
jgi:hypothetical protein